MEGESVNQNGRTFRRYACRSLLIFATNRHPFQIATSRVVGQSRSAADARAMATSSEGSVAGLNWRPVADVGSV